MSDTPTLDEMRHQMARLSERMGFIESGYFPTELPGVKFFWTDQPQPRAPLLYESGLVIVGQGSKSIYIADQEFSYGPDQYLVVGLPLAFECETRASPDAPVLGIFIDIDIATLFELASHVPQRESSSETVGLGVEPVRMHDSMRQAVTRLLGCLCESRDTAVLGPALVREVLYRALEGEHQSVLRSMIQPEGQQARIARVLHSVNAELEKKRSVDEMAAEAGMSSPVFYRAFRAAMGESPLQYIKKLRLTRARSLIVHEHMPANAAAFAVGYESPSQFSREFKAYFGVTTGQARESAYAFIRST